MADATSRPKRSRRSPSPRAVTKTRLVFPINLALAICGALSGCDKPSSKPTKDATNYVPQGTPESVAGACHRAAMLLGIMSLIADDSPEKVRHLDPRHLPGYDPEKQDHNRRAGDRLDHQLSQLKSLENDPVAKSMKIEQLLDLGFVENGWTAVGNGQYRAGEFSWQSLENRVNWCVDHYAVNIVTAQTPPKPEPEPEPAPAPAATYVEVDQYRTERFPGIQGGNPIIIEHQPD